jgi:hypothetical protein
MELAKLAKDSEPGPGQSLAGGVQYSQHTKGGNLKAVVRGGRILVKDIGAQVLEKFLEIRALHLLPAKWAAKLVRNVSKSALCKVARVGTARAAMQMLFTTLRANVPVLTVINSVCVEAVVEIVRVCWPKKQAEASRDAGFDSESRRSLRWHLQPEAARPVAWARCLAVLLSRPARLRASESVAGMTGPFLMLVGGHMHVGYIKLESFIKPCPGDEG